MKMGLAFTLNGKKVMTQANVNSRLIDILRGTFKLIGAKSACLIGVCGACTIVFNGRVTKSCLIPAFQVQGSDVITIESFSETESCQDIINGFEKAGIENCGYCNVGKIFIAEAILAKNSQPSREDILSAFSGIRCRCTEEESLISAVLTAADVRQRRIYGRT